MGQERFRAMAGQGWGRAHQAGRCRHHQSRQLAALGHECLRRRRKVFIAQAQLAKGPSSFSSANLAGRLLVDLLARIFDLPLPLEELFGLLRPRVDLASLCGCRLRRGRRLRRRLDRLPFLARMLESPTARPDVDDARLAIWLLACRPGCARVCAVGNHLDGTIDGVVLCRPPRRHGLCKSESQSVL